MAELLPRLISPALVGVVLAAGLLVIVTDWRPRLAALAGVYVGAAILVTQLVVLDVAVVKLIVGLLVVGILALTSWQSNLGQAPGAPGPAAMPARRRFEVPTGLPFRFMAALMVVVAAFYVASQPQLALPGLDQAPAVNIASYLLMALGLLNLGLTEEPLSAGMGLLTLLVGFEIFYAAVEPSYAIVALLAAVEFGIAMAVSYLAVLRYTPPERSPSP